MKINIKTINLDLSADTKEYVEKKIGSLEKFIQDIRVKPMNIWVEISRTTSHHRKGDVYKVEAQFQFPRKTARAESTREDLRVAVDEVKDELQRKFKQYTGKRDAKYKRGARAIKKIFNLSYYSRFFRRGRIRDEGN
jgi:ribosomal subunit interface protein